MANGHLSICGALLVFLAQDNNSIGSRGSEEGNNYPITSNKTIFKIDKTLGNTLIFLILYFFKFVFYKFVCFMLIFSKYLFSTFLWLYVYFSKIVLSRFIFICLFFKFVIYSSLYYILPLFVQQPQVSGRQMLWPYYVFQCFVHFSSTSIDSSFT